MSYQAPPPPSQQVYVSAGTAFKIGFFGFLGAFLASLIIGALAFLVTLVLGVAVAGLTT